MPQLQNVTRMLCGLVAAASPAIIRRLFGRRAHFGYRPAAVVDRGRLWEDRRCPLVERRHPVRRRVVLAQVQVVTPERSEPKLEARSSCGSRRTCADGSARLAGEDDQVVRRLVGEAAVLDEVHADEVGARSARPARHRLRLAAGNQAAGPSAAAITSMSAPTVISATPLMQSLPPDGVSNWNPATERFRDLRASCYGAVSVSFGPQRRVSRPGTSPMMPLCIEEGSA